jgi:hypothetical protein
MIKLSKNAFGTGMDIELNGMSGKAVIKLTHDAYGTGGRVVITGEVYSNQGTPYHTSDKKLKDNI